MDRDIIIEKVKEFVRDHSEERDPSHDWWHNYRVLRNAVRIGRRGGANLFVVQLAALLHEVGDWKFSGEEAPGLDEAGKYLRDNDVEEEVVSQVLDIVENISFRGAAVKSEMKTEEGKVVQDADRLDALGAVGIARCFAYGGSRGRNIYEPEEEPEEHRTFEEYKNSKSCSINHFHEKLLLLKDRMNTETAEKMAEERHKFIEEFLERFHREWEGEK